MKLSVGMYVRYISGFHYNVQDKPIVLIGKILSVDDYINLDTFFGGGVYPTEDFKKLIRVEPSFNLIDLIGLGDVIIDKEGHKYPINYEFETNYNNDYQSYEITIDDYITLFLKDGLSIVTKEQMEAMQYKVV